MSGTVHSCVLYTHHIRRVYSQSTYYNSLGLYSIRRSRFRELCTRAHVLLLIANMHLCALWLDAQPRYNALNQEINARSKMKNINAMVQTHHPHAFALLDRCTMLIASRYAVVGVYRGGYRPYSVLSIRIGSEWNISWLIAKLVCEQCKKRLRHILSRCRDIWGLVVGTYIFKHYLLYIIIIVLYRVTKGCASDMTSLYKKYNSKSHLRLFKIKKNYGNVFRSWWE